jgi:CRP/FNR family transcriptional regulator, cyclic AMP receptor protein
VARDDKLELMRSVPLFSGLSDGELERISSLSDVIDLPKDRVILTQGELGWEMFVLVTGSARVERDGQSLGERGPGEVLGEIALLDGGPRTATVTALSPVRLVGITGWVFRGLLMEHPSIALKTLEAVAGRLRNVSKEPV